MTNGEFAFAGQGRTQRPLRLLTIIEPETESYMRKPAKRVRKQEALHNVHPGEVLREEFLLPLDVSAYGLAKAIGVSQTRVSEILHGKRSISAETALRFARFFGTHPKFWLGLQEDYDLEEQQRALATKLEAITPWKNAARG